MVAEQRMKYQSAAYHTRLEPDHQKIVQESENSATRPFLSTLHVPHLTKACFPDAQAPPCSTLWKPGSKESRS